MRWVANGVSPRQGTPKSLIIPYKTVQSLVSDAMRNGEAIASAKVSLTGGPRYISPGVWGLETFYFFS